MPAEDKGERRLFNDSRVSAHGLLLSRCEAPERCIEFFGPRR